MQVKIQWLENDVFVFSVDYVFRMALSTCLEKSNGQFDMKFKITSFTCILGYVGYD